MIARFHAAGKLRPHSAASPDATRAVSLVEILLVLAIIGLLLGMLVPSLAYTTEQISRVVCRNNLGQWGKATWYYRNEHDEMLPAEGTYFDIEAAGTWFNELPHYLDLPPYRDFDRIDEELIRQRPNIDVWICPSKNRTLARTSQSGRNQFHYGLNQVLDGLGTAPNGSQDTPGFPDRSDDVPLSAQQYTHQPRTVWMFDIAPNSPAGTPRHVANEHQDNGTNQPAQKFHGDYANVLYLDGSTTSCQADDLVTNRNFSNGDIIWTHSRLYWGYRPPP
ncbi:MAG: type II secretion system protein [Planctomycetota bacterium]